MNQLIECNNDDDDYNIDFGNSDLLIPRDSRMTKDTPVLNYSTLLDNQQNYSQVNPNQPKDRMSLRVLDDIDEQQFEKNGMGKLTIIVGFYTF